MTDAASLVFVDANVIIASSVAAHADYPAARRFFTIRTAGFVSNTLLQLEVLPRAVRTPEPVVREIVEGYFAEVKRWVAIDEPLVAEAQRVAIETGLKALDAVHAVSARRAQAQLVTFDAKANFERVPGLSVRLLER